MLKEEKEHATRALLEQIEKEIREQRTG